MKAATARARAPGLNPRSYPRAVRDFVAIDYEDRLDGAAAQWLARFNSALHSGDFRGWSQQDFPQDERREIWRGLKRAQKALRDSQGVVDMGSKPLKPQPTPPQSSNQDAEEAADGVWPEPVTLVGLAKTAKGHVAVSVVVQGNRVLHQQVHCVPQRREYAALALKQALFSKVLFPQASILNTENEGEK